MNGGKEEGVGAGIGSQPNGELAQMTRLVSRLNRDAVSGPRLTRLQDQG
jgi:hypothetical protein